MNMADHHSVPEVYHEAEELSKEQLAEALESLVADVIHEGDFSVVLDQKGDMERIGALCNTLMNAHEQDDLWAAKDAFRDYLSEIATAYYQPKEELIKERAYEILDEATV